MYVCVGGGGDVRLCLNIGTCAFMRVTMVTESHIAASCS